MSINVSVHQGEELEVKAHAISSPKHVTHCVELGVKDVGTLTIYFDSHQSMYDFIDKLEGAVCYISRHYLEAA